MLIFYSPVIVALTIVACVTGAPSRGFSNPFLDTNDMGYSETVLDPFHPPSKLSPEEIMRKVGRNLDHIGGGYLLRNLDHIGGGNLLRDVKYPEKSRRNQIPDKSVKSKMINENLDSATSPRRAIVDDRDLGSWFEDNAGGDLIAESQFEKNDRSPWNKRPWARVVNDRDESGFTSHLNFVNRVNAQQLDSFGDEKLARSNNQLSTQMRNIDAIGGGISVGNPGDFGEYRILRLDD